MSWRRTLPTTTCRTFRRTTAARPGSGLCRETLDLSVVTSGRSSQGLPAVPVLCFTTSRTLLTTTHWTHWTSKRWTTAARLWPCLSREALDRPFVTSGLPVLFSNTTSRRWVMSDARFCIDYGKRNAKCQMSKCKQQIEKGALRIAKVSTGTD